MRTAPALLIVLAATLALTGCQPDDTPLVVDPSPSVTPIFESDEEALAAAEAAFALYVGVVDAILADGGAQSERLSEVATDEVVKQDEAGFEAARAEGRRSTGSTSFDTLTLQQHDPYAEGGRDVVFIYVCEDFSEKDVLNSDGVSIVSPDRQTRWPLVVGFDQGPERSKDLIVSSVSDWDGNDFCTGS